MKNKLRILLGIFLISYFFFSNVHTMTKTETKEPQSDENPHEVPLDEIHKQRLLTLYKAAQSRDSHLLATLLASAHEHYSIDFIYVMTTLCWGTYGPKISTSDSTKNDETEKFLKKALEQFRKEVDLKRAVPTRARDKE